jgi:hypothetical protein
MARTTTAQLRAEIEALRHNLELARSERDAALAECEALRAKPAAAPAVAVRRAAPKPAVRGTTRPVFEFDPSIKGDFARASRLAQAAGGSVRRMAS